MMARSIHLELARIFQAIEIHSPTLFSFNGEKIDISNLPPPIQLPGHPIHPVPEHSLVRALQSVLYRRCYTHQLGEPVPAEALAVVPDANLMARLSAANQSRDCWNAGWRVYKVDPSGQVFLVKGDRQSRALPGSYIIEDFTFRAPQVGVSVMLRMPRESFVLQPGFYFVFGEQPSDVWDEHFTVRYYFNTSAEGAVSLLESLTRLLNRYQVAFRMKALTTLNAYSRADSAVLYVARRDCPFVTQLLGHLPASVRSALRPATPLFTKPLAPGIGCAEDPGTSESFGMHRCRLLAEGIVDAYLTGQQTRAARARAASRRFVTNGLNLERPYLNPGTTDLFESVRGYEGTA